MIQQTRKTPAFPTRSIRMLPTALALLATAGAVCSAAEVSFKHYRFTANQNFDTTTTTQIQLSEFQFRHRGTILNINNSTGVGANIPVTVSGGTNPPTSGEHASKVTDGSVDTKWFDGNRASSLLFSFDNNVTVDSYNFATANDSLDRTPAGWTLEGSYDGTTFVTIDTRANVAIIPALKTYQNGWTISGGVLPGIALGTTAPPVNPAGYGVASPATVLTGGSTSLSWEVTNATGAITFQPSNTATTAIGTQVVSPVGSLTRYGIDASNASGTASATANVRVVPGASASYSYVRFTPISLRDNLAANSIQIGEFEFFNAGNEVAVLGVSNPGGNAPAGEPAADLIDGDPASKWLDFNKRGVIFDLGEENTFDSYQIVTANDATERDAVRWILEGSNDLENWALIDAVTGANYPTPTRRITATGILPISGRTLQWKSGSTGTWDTVSQNFTPTSTSTTPTAYADGEAVAFADDGAPANIVLSAPVTPGHVSFYNSTTNYTVSGSEIQGQGALLKEGSGSVTLSNANSFTGPILLNHGSIVANAAGSLGPRYVKSDIAIENGSTLSVPVTQISGRTLTLSGIGGGGTIEVGSGATFTHYGRINFGNTLTKTGSGVLRFEDYNTSTTAAFEDLVINGGVVEFGSSHFNAAPLGGRSMRLVVNAGGTLRTTADHALGGDYIDGNTSVEQIRVIGGTLQLNAFTYLATGFIGDEGRTVLDAGVIEGTAQIENANSFEANVTTNPEQRSVISTLPNALSSEIRGTGVLNTNSGHWNFRVADGAAQDDLIISKLINGTYGIIKEGAGNLTLTNANVYAGTPGGAITLQMPDGTTVRGGTLTARNTTGSATGAGTVLVQAAGTLAGPGIITGATTIAGTVSPGEGNGVGTLTLGATALTGTFLCQVNGAAADKLVVNGNLNITGATLTVSANAPVGDTFVIASYTGDLTGSFAVTNLPAGFTVSVNAAAKQIELKSTVTGGETYESWAATLSNPSADADEDGDGLDNGIEFVLGSDPEVSAFDKLPSFVRNGNGDLVFTFPRTERSVYLNPVVEYSTSLTAGTWTTFGPGTASAPVGGVATVTATLPASLAGPNGKLFARLKVTVPN